VASKPADRAPAASAHILQMVSSTSPHTSRSCVTKLCAEGAETLGTYPPGDQGGGHAWPGAVIPSELAAANPPEKLPANTPGTEINSSASLPLHVPIVAMSVKVPVEPMLYIETSFEPEFVT
jgi:hypothetical protein